MGVYKELDITFQEIVEQYIETGNHATAEHRIWSEIGIYDRDLADHLTDTYSFEAALVQIENGNIPHKNLYWQTLVIRTAYNMITDIDEFKYICEYSRFSEQEVQRLIDLAVGAVLSNPEYVITSFETHTK